MVETRSMDVGIISDPAVVAALVDPARRRLIEALDVEPDSSTGLARRLGETRQRLNYHLRALEDAGLVELHEERQRRGFTERVFRPVARRYVVDPAALGVLGAGDEVDAGDRFSAAFAVGLAARVVREIAALVARAASGRKRIATASLDGVVHLSRPADFPAFVDDLGRAIADVVAKHDAGEGGGARPFRVVTAIHQKPPASDA